MTIIDELLILLDDLGEASPEVIPQYLPDQTLQAVFSSLGRLVSRGWAVKKAKRQALVYSITLHGVNELNHTLDVLKNKRETEWDRRWRLAIFDIPESKRKLRDLLRSYLKQEGYGLLKSSVWFSPWDKKEALRKFARRHNVLDHLIQIESSEFTDTYQAVVLIRESWDWPTIEKNYHNFINQTQKELPKLKKDPPDQRFRAKKIIFSYGEVVKSDPRLPASITPHSSLARRAEELYKLVRPYCLVGK